jgi:aldehyde dehydrogenase (NAD+)
MDRDPATGAKTAPAPTAPSAPVWDYSPAPEKLPVEIPPRLEMYVNGAFVAPRSRRHFPTINPATEEVLSEVPEAGAADVDAAVEAARKAQRKWAKQKPIVRARYLFRIARRIQERARELAVLESMDGGKPIRESRDVDVPIVARHFFYHAGWADKLDWAIPGGNPGPVGVCGQIIPWNFPLMMAAWKLAPALACGNTCVLKPAETTPITALRLAEIFAEVELPPGVANVITGAGETGALMVGHPGFDKIAFTGSTEVGKKIAAACAGRGTRLTLELGGKSPHIIFADAPIDEAVEGAVLAAYFNQGHTCCAGSRLLVEEPVVDLVVDKIARRMHALKVGDPLDKNTDIGAINSKQQLATIRRYLDTGIEEGGELHQVHDEPLPARGFWCRPCFLTGIQPTHIVAREEIFGPVLTIMTFRTPEEAIARANDTPYGLAAGVWTGRGEKAFEMARRIKAGVIWCNTYHRFDAAAPFGGYKESGFGREGGLQGLFDYLAKRA